MPKYKFTAIDAVNNPHHGTVEASSTEEAEKKIRALGYFPRSVSICEEPADSTKQNTQSKSEHTCKFCAFFPRRPAIGIVEYPMEYQTSSLKYNETIQTRTFSVKIPLPICESCQKAIYAKSWLMIALLISILLIVVLGPPALLMLFGKELIWLAVVIVAITSIILLPLFAFILVCY